VSGACDLLHRISMLDDHRDVQTASLGAASGPALTVSRGRLKLQRDVAIRRCARAGRHNVHEHKVSLQALGKDRAVLDGPETVAGSVVAGDDGSGVAQLGVLGDDDDGAGRVGRQIARHAAVHHSLQRRAGGPPGDQQACVVLATEAKQLRHDPPLDELHRVVEAREHLGRGAERFAHPLALDVGDVLGRDARESQLLCGRRGDRHGVEDVGEHQCSGELTRKPRPRLRDSPCPVRIVDRAHDGGHPGHGS
jgi:hypothetical protein